MKTELQQDSADLHRIVGQDLYSITVQMNITPKYNHLSPLCGTDVDNTSKNHSKLWHLPAKQVQDGWTNFFF